MLDSNLLSVVYFTKQVFTDVQLVQKLLHSLFGFLSAGYVWREKSNKKWNERSCGGVGNLCPRTSQNGETLSKYFLKNGN